MLFLTSIKYVDTWGLQFVFKIFQKYCSPIPKPKSQSRERVMEYVCWMYVRDQIMRTWKKCIQWMQSCMTKISRGNCNISEKIKWMQSCIKRSSRGNCNCKNFQWIQSCMTSSERSNRQVKFKVPITPQVIVQVFPRL